MVLDVKSALEVVVSSADMAEVTSVPEAVLEGRVTGAVPVEGAIESVLLSVAAAVVVELVSESVSEAGVSMTEPVADAEEALSVVKWLERSEFMEEAALDRMLENPADKDSGTAESVAVAAWLDKPELRDDAKLDKAADASLVIAAVPVAVGLPLASESTEDSAEATALEKSEAAEDTRPGAAPVSEGDD